MRPPSAASSAPHNDKVLSTNSQLETKRYLVCEALQDHTNVLAVCIKCEFLAFPTNTIVLDFLNINEIWFLSVILGNGAQNNTSQISVAGKIFVV